MTAFGCAKASQERAEGQNAVRASGNSAVRGDCGILSASSAPADDVLDGVDVPGAEELERRGWEPDMSRVCRCCGLRAVADGRCTRCGATKLPPSSADVAPSAAIVVARDARRLA